MKSSVNPYSPGSKQFREPTRIRPLPLPLLPLVVTGAIATGMALEYFATGIQIEVSRIPALLLLSPLMVTVGGGHFPFPGSLRIVFGLLGLMSIPIMTTTLVCAWKFRSVGTYLLLFVVVAFFYFGIIHKHLAVMSI